MLPPAGSERPMPCGLGWRRLPCANALGGGSAPFGPSPAPSGGELGWKWGWGWEEYRLIGARPRKLVSCFLSLATPVCAVGESPLPNPGRSGEGGREEGHPGTLGTRSSKGVLSIEILPEYCGYKEDETCTLL